MAKLFPLHAGLPIWDYTFRTKVVACHGQLELLEPKVCAMSQSWFHFLWTTCLMCLRCTTDAVAAAD